ncbi:MULTISPECIES: thioesterase family protein [unclassified Halomonas]|uniref:acyl-CoA thioesterase n=1 Tax=unclassified Halomonas TaxID=2609666 RepID=UPI00209EF532|nr:MULTISPECIES: thioesterase family protein [unclassified Halomonas]MCP1314627.1 thioesterase family protein [Halomonas sp. 707D7]MCP1325471.1 thioesterase family protein [Halomonas sp. 707D4]
MARMTLDFPEALVIHRHSLSVRITDMNYGRHLGHDALVSLLAEARACALASLGFPEWDLAGYPSVVADLTVTYQQEARFPEPLAVETAIPDPDGKALVVHHRLRNADGATVATARVTLLLVDLETRRPVAVPSDFTRALARARGA